MLEAREEEEFIARRSFGLKKGIEVVVFGEFDILPVVETSASDGLFANIKGKGVNEDQAHAEGDASAPDTPGVTGNFGRI